MFSSSNISDPALKDCLFGVVTLTKSYLTKNIDKYKYSGYGIGFDRRSSFSFPSGGFIDNKKKDILVLGKDQHKD